MNWINIAIGACFASSFLFFILFMNSLAAQRREDERLSREDERLTREFDEEMRKFYPKWKKR